MLKFFYAALIMLCCTQCRNAAERAKNAINKAGETAGEAGSEFAKGVKEGIDKSFDCSIELSQSLKDKGMETGKIIISGSSDSSSNILSAYLVFNKDFSSVITVKVFDSKGLEYGRLQKNLQGKKGDASFVDFVFNTRTDIEHKSKFIIE